MNVMSIERRTQSVLSISEFYKTRFFKINKLWPSAVKDDKGVPSLLVNKNSKEPLNYSLKIGFNVL